MHVYLASMTGASIAEKNALHVNLICEFLNTKERTALFFSTSKFELFNGIPLACYKISLLFNRTLHRCTAKSSIYVKVTTTTTTISLVSLRKSVNVLMLM